MSRIPSIQHNVWLNKSQLRAMLREMKGFNTCLLISGHIKEDQGVPGRIKQPEEETRKNLLSKQRGMKTSGSLSEWRGEGEDREEAVAHPGLPMSFKAHLFSEWQEWKQRWRTRASEEETAKGELRDNSKCSQIFVGGKTSFIGSKSIPDKACVTILYIVFLQLIGKCGAFLFFKTKIILRAPGWLSR